MSTCIRFMLAAVAILAPLAAKADPFDVSSRAGPGVVQFEQSLRERGLPGLWGSTAVAKEAALDPNQSWPRRVKTPISAGSFRIDNLGSRNIAFSYEKAPGQWEEVQLNPREWRDLPCEACGSTTKIAFHNGTNAALYDVKLDQEVVIEWSDPDNAWILTTRTVDALKRIPETASLPSPSERQP